VNDLIDRQAAIDAINGVLVEDDACKVWFRLALQNLPSAQPEPIRLHVDHAFTEEEIKNLKQKISDSPIVFIPSAEKPFKLPEIYVADGYDTVADEDGNVGFGVYVPDENQIYVAGDVEDEIRAKALLHELCHWVQAMCGRSFDEDEANEFSDIVYDALPSAQPERKRGKWEVDDERPD
jgi:hypothetical protein